MASLREPTVQLESHADFFNRLLALLLHTFPWQNPVGCDEAKAKDGADFLDGLRDAADHAGAWGDRPGDGGRGLPGVVAFDDRGPRRGSYGRMPGYGNLDAALEAAGQKMEECACRAASWA
jgi:hypothetical protein